VAAGSRSRWVEMQIPTVTQLVIWNLATAGFARRDFSQKSVSRFPVPNDPQILSFSLCHKDPEIVIYGNLIALDSN